MMKLIDSHCHLQDDRIIENAQELINRAHTRGIEKLAVCGSAPADWEAVLRLAREYREVIPFFGVHPWYVKKAGKDWLDQLKVYLDCVPSGIGEIGLDHAIDDRDDELQEELFITQLQLAGQYGSPVEIHCRQAWDVMTSLLKKYLSSAGGIIHSFSGSEEIVRELLKYNIFFSFSGSITRPDNMRVRRALAAVPLNRLLIETDSPDIPVMINQSIDYDSPNTPEHLIYVLKEMAIIKNISEETLSEYLWNNSHVIFKFSGVDQIK